MNPSEFDPLGEQSKRVCKGSYQALGAEFNVVSNSEALLELVHEAFADLPRHELDTGAPQCHIELKLTPAKTSLANSDLPPLRFQSGSEFIIGAYNAKNLAVVCTQLRSAFVHVSDDMLTHRRELRYELIEFAFLMLAPRIQGLLPLHAACVGQNGKGILISGSSGAGKSTLCFAAMQLGLEFLAEDGVFVSPESLLATGCPNFVHLRSDSPEFVTDEKLRASIMDSPTILRRNGDQKFEVDIRRLDLSIANQPLRLAALVLLSTDRTAQSSSPLIELPTQIALDELVAEQRYAVSCPGWDQFVTHLTSLPAFRLQRTAHPHAAAETLQALLKTLEK